MRTEINGKQIAYTDEGQGPTIILIHGFPLDRSMWTRQIDVLTNAGYRVVVPDLRGFGESGPPAPNHSMDDYADDVANLMMHLGVGRAVIGGMSMGGYVLLNLLSRYPKRIAGAAFLMTRCTADDDAGRKRREEMADAVRQGKRQEVLDNFVQLVLSPQTLENHPAVIEEVKRIMASSSEQGLIAALLAMKNRPDYSGRLNSIEIPSLVVGGREDQAVPVGTVHSFAEGLPKGSLCLIENAGHMANLEQSDAFNACLLEFLQKF